MKKALFLAAALAAATFGIASAEAAPLPGASAGIHASANASVTPVAMHHRHHMMKKRHHMMMKRHHMRHHRRMMHHG